MSQNENNFAVWLFFYDPVNDFAMRGASKILNDFSPPQNVKWLQTVRMAQMANDCIFWYGGDPMIVASANFSRKNLELRHLEHSLKLKENICYLPTFSLPYLIWTYLSNCVHFSIFELFELKNTRFGIRAIVIPQKRVFWIHHFVCPGSILSFKTPPIASNGLKMPY